ncbi:ribosome biogenesis protein S.t1.c1 [Apiospora arundinis]
MTPRIQDVDPEVDFPAMARCLFESYEDPPQPFFHAARGAAIEEAAARLKLWNAHDKTMYWQKVNIHKENPFANPSASEVTWFPDDGSRRRQGVGHQFMNWGMKKADELGFDFYLDSTPSGRPLYEANGFRYLEENVNIPVVERIPGEKWKEVEEKVSPLTFWLMWRSVNGIYERRESQVF